MNDVFHIWHSGHFGTICGFRLGYLSSQEVDWIEINAAWGMTAMLLHLIAKELNYSFKEYKVVPRGSLSRMQHIKSENDQFELYYEREMNPLNVFWRHRFDKAMGLFLGCLQQIIENIQSIDNTFVSPYKIKGDTINGISIQLQSDESYWTRALKYMLTDIKYITSWLCGNKYANQFQSS